MGLIPRAISSLINIIELLIIIECILSWIVRGDSEVMNIIRSITAPILEPFRRLQYKFLGDTPIDISPILAIITLGIIQKVVFILF